jgi:hypothetical protein
MSLLSPEVIGSALAVVGIGLGGWLSRRKPKVDRHSAVVTDSTAFGRLMLERQEKQDARLDSALGRIDQLEEKEQQRDELARQHIKWDWRLMRQLHDQGIEVPDPPPLFVYDNLTKGV